MAGAGILASLPGAAMADERAGTVRKKIGPIVQHGYVVRDAARTALQWAERMGVGPFYMFEAPIQNYIYRGKPTPLTLRTGVSYWQGMQIELIQQTSSAPTFYTEALRKAPERLNHFAVMVPDIDAAIASLDAAKYVVHSGGTDGGLTFKYLENYLPDGTTLEFMSAPQNNLMAFEGMKAVSRAWDGTKPLRTMTDLMSDLGALAKGAQQR
jgi:Glyoxalase/Bleomycin resistance protein/Dioxygenase superfamily